MDSHDLKNYNIFSSIRPLINGQDEPWPKRHPTSNRDRIIMIRQPFLSAYLNPSSRIQWPSTFFSPQPCPTTLPCSDEKSHEISTHRHAYRPTEETRRASSMLHGPCLNLERWCTTRLTVATHVLSLHLAMMRHAGASSGDIYHGA
jgi:hypothetical protein